MDVAANGHEALACIASSHYDCVVSDIQMPDSVVLSDVAEAVTRVEIRTAACRIAALEQLCSLWYTLEDL